MNDPKRWDLWEVILEATDSQWARWEDYARLNAEVEVQNRRINLRDEDVGKLHCENARLKAEVERLKSLCDSLGMGGKHTITAIVDENARLRASSFVTAVPVEEYEKLAKENDNLHKGIYSLSLNVAQLKVEVERLRKAGDAMADALNLDDDVFDNHDKKEARANWNAAKDGKLSA
jgi:predicted RNase H-like nuclease (RuvC/YqgF family)